MAQIASTALIPVNTFNGLTTRSYGALIHGSLSDPAPGRTLHQLQIAIAHDWGLGPCAIVQRIEAFFGVGNQRQTKLEEVCGQGHPVLEKEFSKLIAYTLPQESARTQLQAFKSVVKIITRYPGTRTLLLKAKHFDRPGYSQTTLAALWARADESSLPDWDFHSKFAAACLADQDISGILAGTSCHALGSVQNASGGLPVIDRLLVASECIDVNPFSCSLALRYLGGILELPTFWLESGPVHRMVLKKILIRLEFVLRDLGLDTPQIDGDAAADIIGDTEGIDLLATAILTEICSWNNSGVESECWYESLGTVVGLLRGSIAEGCLPTASRLATSSEVANIYSAANEVVDVFLTVPDGPYCLHDDRPGNELNESKQDIDAADTRPIHVDSLEDQGRRRVSIFWDSLGRDFLLLRGWAWGARTDPQSTNLPMDQEPQSTTRDTRRFRSMRGLLRKSPPPQVLSSDARSIVMLSDHALLPFAQEPEDLEASESPHAPHNTHNVYTDGDIPSIVTTDLTDGLPPVNVWTSPDSPPISPGLLTPYWQRGDKLGPGQSQDVFPPRAPVLADVWAQRRLDVPRPPTEAHAQRQEIEW
ncbi:hypothetical protein FB451DRAFT_1567286 [Mycena latifolia]|nr:hypothetical protein FB451DRAFT_1567286 [Mycena latifolia]